MLYPDYENVAYFVYEGEVTEGNGVQIITQATYNQHKTKIETAPKPLTDSQRIEELEAQNAELMFAMAELASANEQDKIETQLAIAELATLVTETGGVA